VDPVRPAELGVRRRRRHHLCRRFVRDGNAKKGELRGIVIGNARDGSLAAFIPDPTDLDTVENGTSASGIAADGEGTIYAADVGAHNLRKYVKAK
jgi:hypothetical protein